jgi:hypothetical protein
MFNANSGLVKTWVALVKQGVYTLENVPNLSNLREVVTSVLEGGVDNEVQ